MSSSQSSSMSDVEYDGQELKAATMDALTAMVAAECGQEAVLGRLSRMFFLVHKWYVNSPELAALFIDIYTTSLDGKDKKQFKRERPQSIVQSLKLWAEEFPEHFQKDERLFGILNEFRKRSESDGYTQLSPVVERTLRKQLVTERPVYLTIKSSPESEDPDRRVSYSFHSMPSKAIAEHLTLLDHQAFSNITFEEWTNYARNGKPFGCPTIQEAIVLFNGISCWVQSKVLSEMTPEKRARIMTKYIEVAEHLRALGNYNGLVSVVGGLNSSSLLRLKRTFEALPAKSKATLDELTFIVSSDGNYGALRKALEASLSKDCFVLPAIGKLMQLFFRMQAIGQAFVEIVCSCPSVCAWGCSSVGVCLKDLIAVHNALKDRTENGLINFRKLSQLYQLFNDIDHYQRLKPPVASDKDLLDILRISVQPRFTADELYEVSLTREPRSSKAEESTQAPKSPLFGDWTAGSATNVDEATLKKYIAAMVDAVFRTYDTDKNGYISMEEFQDFSSNFPFLDSFAVLDTNSDGVISREELSGYFFQANLPMMRRSFQHVFHETNYFSPTFCYHCKGLLWGLIKQGFKCKNCGVNCHRSCKDVVVTECRRDTVQNTTPTLKRKLVRKKTGAISQYRKQSRSSETNGDLQTDSRHNFSRLEESHGLVIAENSRLKSRVKEAESELEKKDNALTQVQIVLEQKTSALKRTESALQEKASALKETEDALRQAHYQIQQLRQEMDTVRQGTIDYVLQHMSEFSKTRSTDV